jgi:hypothetical protein
VRVNKGYPESSTLLSKPNSLIAVISEECVLSEIGDCDDVFLSPLDEQEAKVAPIINKQNMKTEKK